MEKEKDSLLESATDENDNPVPSQIQAFAAKLGEETGGKFTCYIYRIVKDEESGRNKKPFVQKYVGQEPDPFEIAEKHRGGKYLCQFIWYVKGKQNSRSYTLDVDTEAFPPVSKDKSIIPYMNQGTVSEPMALQLAMIHEISEVMKASYSSGNGARSGMIQQDPLEAFAGIMETMESSFARAMAIQSKIMERVYTRNMERQFGLAEEVAPASSVEEESGIIGKYAPVVREVVEGIKSVIALFGDVPPAVVKTVIANNRFKELLKDQKALVVIGQALRREFGDNKAGELMNTFGVRMVIQTPKRGEIARTPEIAALKGQGQAIRDQSIQKPQTEPKNGKTVLKGKGQGKGGISKKV